MKQTTRCPECDEPEFMCECAKNFVGKRVQEVYHKGLTIDSKELKHQLFTLTLLPTIIIGRLAFTLACPDRHGDKVLRGAR